MSTRLTAARAALLHAVAMYAPVEQAVGAQARMALERAMDDIQNSAHEAAPPALVMANTRIANTDATARTLGFESLTEALGHLHTTQDAVQAMGFAHLTDAVDYLRDLVELCKEAGLTVGAVTDMLRKGNAAQGIGVDAVAERVQDASPPAVPPPQEYTGAQDDGGVGETVVTGSTEPDTAPPGSEPFAASATVDESAASDPPPAAKPTEDAPKSKGKGKR